MRKIDEPKKMHIWEVSNNPSELIPNPIPVIVITETQDFQEVVNKLDAMFAEGWEFDNLNRKGEAFTI